MFLKSLNIKNFRNYKQTSHKFNNRVTILVGDNAQGKSNFLESIYFLATAKSQKAERDEELIRYGEDVLRVEGQVEVRTTQNISNSEILINRNSGIPSYSESFRVNLDIAMQFVEDPPGGRAGRLKKAIKVNGIPKRTSDYSEHLAVVAFAPEDINLVTGSPSLRRSHIDQVLSQVDHHYKKTLSDYENIVIRKNKLLKMIREGGANPLELAYWTKQQVELGAKLTDKRYELFNFLNSAEKKSGPSANGFKYEYLPNLVSQARLLEYQSREIESAVSLVGPHRDDFAFVILEGAKRLIESEKRSYRPDKSGLQDDKMRDLSKYGSRGEQRTAVLDLKIAAVSFMEAKLGSRPVLLLDDIFSELDLEHKKHAVELARLQQTVITTVELDKYLQNQFKDAEVLRVEEGKISSNF